MNLKTKKIIGCTLLVMLFVDLLTEQALFSLASSFGILGAMGYLLSCIFISVGLITNTSLRTYIDGFASLFSNETSLDSQSCCDNEKSNFCGTCGTQLNPNAYSKYLVTLSDGTEIPVTAINPAHAKSLVLYGEDLAFDGNIGQPLGVAIMHHDNVKSVRVL